MHTFENIMKPNTEKWGRRDKWEYNGGGKFVQSILYTHMELSQ
jgi:hypothetical protein